MMGYPKGEMGSSPRLWLDMGDVLGLCFLNTSQVPGWSVLLRIRSVTVPQSCCKERWGFFAFCCSMGYHPPPRTT